MSRAAEPRGRKELLFWLNSLCNAEYPAVESLRDGTVYCTVIEAAVSRIAQNCIACHTTDREEMRRRANQAAKALSLLEWSATASVCENVDQSLDTMTVRKVCRKNIDVLQDMLRHCVPPDHVRTIDGERLSRGKLQDHVKFLQWLYQFMTKVLSQYSKSALEEKAERKTGLVSGVRLNRATKLLEHKRHAPTQEFLCVPTHQLDSTVTIGSDGMPKSTRQSTSRTTNSPGVYPHKSVQLFPSCASEATLGLPVDVPRTRTDTHEAAEDVPAEPVGTPAAAPSPASVVSHYQRGATAIPSELKDILLQLRSSVEELESNVYASHETHQQSLTREESIPDDLTPLSCLPLSGLGKLLEQRDTLAQVFAAVDSIVHKHHARGLPTPLLTDMCAILYP